MMGTYREVAGHENITPQAVCDTLKNSRALQIKSAEENLLDYFRKFPICTADQLLADDGALLR